MHLQQTETRKKHTANLSQENLVDDLGAGFLVVELRQHARVQQNRQTGINLDCRARHALTISDRPVAVAIEDRLDHEYMAAIDALEEPEPTLDEVYRATSLLPDFL